MFTLGGAVIVWRSVKQCTAKSTMKVEYMTASKASKESVWLRMSYYNLEVVPNMDKPLTLYFDNNGVVTNSKEPKKPQDKEAYIKEVSHPERIYRQ